MRSRNRLAITREAIIELAETVHAKSYTLTIDRGAIVADGMSTLVFHCAPMRGWRVARVGREGARGWSEITDMGMVRGLVLELANAYANYDWWWHRFAEAKVQALLLMSVDAVLMNVFDQLGLGEE